MSKTPIAVAISKQKLSNCYIYQMRKHTEDTVVIANNKTRTDEMTPLSLLCVAHPATIYSIEIMLDCPIVQLSRGVVCFVD